MEIDLKLHGDKIKLETRPASRESSASSKSAYLAKGPARPVSAVPMLSLYKHKDDYEDISLSSLRPYSADNFRSNNKMDKALTISDLEKTLPSSILHKTIICKPIGSWCNENEENSSVKNSDNANYKSSSSSDESEEIVKKSLKILDTKLTPGLKTKPPMIPKRSLAAAAHNDDKQVSICDEEKVQSAERETDLLFGNLKKQQDEIKIPLLNNINACDSEKQSEILLEHVNENFPIPNSERSIRQKISNKQSDEMKKERKYFECNFDDQSWMSARNVFNNNLEDKDADVDTTSEATSDDDITTILETLERESLKSQNQIQSIKKIVNNELNAHINTPRNELGEQRMITKKKKSKNEFLSHKNYDDIFLFLDEVEKASAVCIMNAQERVETTKQLLHDTLNISAINFDTVPKVDDLLNHSPLELSNQIVDLNLRLKEKLSAIKTLQNELHTLRKDVMHMTSNQDKQVKEKLCKQKQECDAVVKRHQKFIDQLIGEKKQLSQQCELMVKEMRTMEERYTSNMKANEHRHTVEMQKMKDMILSHEKTKRDRWMDTKTKQIKELTVKSIEPELEAMTIRHENAMAELRALHKKEIEDIELKNSRKLNQHLEELRQQMIEEREKYLMHEREALRVRYETLIEAEEKTFQEQKKRMLQEHSNRLAECDKRELTVNKQKERALKEMQQQFDETTKSLLRRHENELQVVKEKCNMEMETMKNNWRKEQELELSNKEQKIRANCRRERDREIEKIIERLEKEAAEIKKQNETITEKRISRLKEKYENEINDLEISEKECQKKYIEMKAKLLDADDTIANLRANAKHFECEWRKVEELYEKLSNEKSTMKENLREEMRSEITVLEKEMERIKSDRDIELQQVYGRVKVVIARKDEMLGELNQENISLKEKCVCLERMLEQQRKEYLITS